MRFYLAHVLCNVGVYRGGCTLYAEHGTAAVREPLEKLLNQYSKVPIRVQRSDIEGVRQYAQLYSGKGGGNPRLKAGYESLHNLTHNETGALPAQTGRDRVEPESLYGLKDINTKLLIACYAMTPARASLIRFPAMSWDAGVEAIRSAYYNMNRREDHDLEGWRDAGFVKEQFRLGPNDHWRNRAELERIPADKRAVVEAFIAHPDYHRTVYMSPWDVWKSGQGDLVRLPKHCLFLICGADLGVVRECPPTDQIVFESQSVEPGPMIYETRYTDLEGREIRLEEGEEYRWLINPFDARQMFVGRLDGGYLGMCRRCDRPSKVDIQGLEQEFKTASKREAEAAREAIAINRRLIEQRIEDARHNAAVLAGEAVLPEEVFEKAADARKRKALARFKPDPLVEDDAGGGQEPAAVAVGVEEGGAELEIGNLL
jgi:hypothetical protein